MAATPTQPWKPAPRTFTCAFAGVCVRTMALKRRNLTVVARDTYDATDRLNDKYGLRDKFVSRTYVFGAPKLKLSAAAKRAILNAGAEEE